MRSKIPPREDVPQRKRTEKADPGPVPTIGELAAEAAQAFGAEARCARDYQTAADLVRPVLNQAGTVLVKGSRSAGMDAVITALQATEEMH